MISAALSECNRKSLQEKDIALSRGMPQRAHQAVAEAGSLIELTGKVRVYIIAGVFGMANLMMIKEIS